MWARPLLQKIYDDLTAIYMNKFFDDHDDFIYVALKNLEDAISARERDFEPDLYTKDLLRAHDMRNED